MGKRISIEMWELAVFLPQIICSFGVDWWQPWAPVSLAPQPRTRVFCSILWTWQGLLGCPSTWKAGRQAATVGRMEPHVLGSWRAHHWCPFVAALPPTGAPSCWGSEDILPIALHPLPIHCPSKSPPTLYFMKYQKLNKWGIWNTSSVQEFCFVGFIVTPLEKLY